MTSTRSCPVCGEQNSEMLFQTKDSPGRISRCLNCRMVYVDYIIDRHALIFDGPVIYDKITQKMLTSSNLNDVKDTWEFSYLLPVKEVEWPALRQNALNALQRIECHINKPFDECKILDFGSGWGFFLAAAKENGWNPFGLEPLPASSIYARAKFGLNIVTDTLREKTFPPAFFDAITSFQVFEHLPYPDKDIQHLHKSLRPGGIILIEVPNFETWTMWLLKSRHRHFSQDHLNFFSAATLDRFLTSHGFRVVEKYHPARIMSIRHLIKYWFPRYLPVFFAEALEKSLLKTSISNRTIRLNIGDIVTVIARKL